MLQWGRERGLAARWVTGLVTIGADGLNGAASARSRKCPSPEWSRFARTASMGPRARARGNARSISRSMWRGWLQWGRERALAEMSPAAGQRLPAIFASMGPRARARGNRPILLDFPHRCSFWLQWGRERALAEIRQPDSAQPADRHASMGPRARARGNIEPPRLLTMPRPASMGPRARARGNAAVPSGPA